MIKILISTTNKIKISKLKLRFFADIKINILMYDENGNDLKEINFDKLSLSKKLKLIKILYQERVKIGNSDKKKIVMIPEYYPFDEKVFLDFQDFFHQFNGDEIRCEIEIRENYIF